MRKCELRKLNKIGAGVKTRLSLLKKCKIANRLRNCEEKQQAPRFLSGLVAGLVGNYMKKVGIEFMC